MPPMSVAQAFKSEESAIVHVVVAALSVAEGIAKFAFLLTVFVWQLIFLLGIGVALVLMREGFMYAIPFLLKHADIIVDIINIGIIALIAFSDAVIFAYDYIAEVVDLFGGKWPVIDPWAFTTLTKSEYKHALTFISTECAPYNALVPIYQTAVLPYVSEYTCPYARLAIPAVGKDFVLQFTDTLTADPSPYENNCDVEFPTTTTLAVCVPLASGYFISEILFPLMIIGLFAWSCFGSIRHCVWSSIQLVIITLESFVRLSSQTVSQTVAFIERKKNV